MRDYDSTVARVAGNIAGHLLHRPDEAYDPAARERIASIAVALALEIVKETKRRTERT